MGAPIRARAGLVPTNAGDRPGRGAGRAFPTSRGFRRVARAIRSIGLPALLAAAAACADESPVAPSPLDLEVAPGPAAAAPSMVAGADAPSMVAGADTAAAGTRMAMAAPGVDASTHVGLKATAPDPVAPAEGVTIKGLTVTLVATSARAKYLPDVTFNHRFELWEGSSGAWLKLDEGIAPPASGPVRYPFEEPLNEATLHRWRARAELDGAPGPWSDWATFRTPRLKRLEPPTPRHPVNGVEVKNLRPSLRVVNGVIAAPDGAVTYVFQVDDDSSFGSPLRTTAPRSGGAAGKGETVARLTADLDPATRYFWRVRARDDTQAGAWSTPAAEFRTPALPPPPPRGADEIDASAVTYLHRNIANWPITSTVTRITIRNNGICVYHTGAGTFPTSKLGAPGEEIDVEGNVWVFSQFGTRWYGATWDYLRPGQQCKSESTDALGVDQIRKPPMDHTWKPKSGDKLCFAASARARDHVQAGRVRSNIACTIKP